MVDRPQVADAAQQTMDVEALKTLSGTEKEQCGKRDERDNADE